MADEPQGQGEAEAEWTTRRREAVLFWLGVGIITAESIGSLLGRPADSIVMAGGLALAGLAPILRKEANR